jgi:hypothetical protein
MFNEYGSTECRMEIEGVVDEIEGVVDERERGTRGVEDEYVLKVACSIATYNIKPKSTFVSYS